MDEKPTIDPSAPDDIARLVKKFLRGRPLSPVETSAVRAKLRPLFDVDPDAALVLCMEDFRGMRDGAKSSDMKIKAQRQIFLVLREIDRKKNANGKTEEPGAGLEHLRHLRPMFPKHEDPDDICRAAALEIGKVRAAKPSK